MPVQQSKPKLCIVAYSVHIFGISEVTIPGTSNMVNATITILSV